MLRNRIFHTILSLLLPGILLLSGMPLGAEVHGGEEALSSVKKMVGLIRFSARDKKYADRALEHIDLDSMTRFLMGGYYDKATADEKTRFETLLGEYIKYRAFPMAVDYFKDVHLSYDELVEKGDTIEIKSSVLYMNKERIVFTWILKRRDGSYFVTDLLDNTQTSAMKNNRDRTVQPILKKRGVAGLLAQFEKIVSSYK